MESKTYTTPRYLKFNFMKMIKESIFNSESITKIARGINNPVLICIVCCRFMLKKWNGTRNGEIIKSTDIITFLTEALTASIPVFQKPL